MRIVLLCLMLAGCASTPPPSLQEVPQHHPDLPRPYEECRVDWKVINHEGWPFIGVPYPQNLDLKVCGKDKERYIIELLNIVCHYQKCEKQ